MIGFPAGLGNMVYSKSTLIALAALLAIAPLSANAHMILKSPVPYGVQTKDPLAENLADFPCKGIPYTVNTMNEWTAGSTQELGFIGTAVHGGGSCQISVTADKTPTPASKWKVIHSIEGGCPLDVAGNLDEFGPSINKTFPFIVPKELPNGGFSGAWTWFNRIGNREMYMACFPIKVSGGSDNKAAFEALPDMAVANIGGPGGCKTKENSDYLFPNPGQYVTKAGLKDTKLDPLCAEGALPGGAPAGGDTAPQPTPAVSQATAASQAPAPGSPGSTLRPVVSVTASVGVPDPTGGAKPAPSQALVPVPAPAPAPAPVPAPAPASGSSTGTACTTEGALVCNGETQWGLCNHGKVVWGAVAAGTRCIGGKITKRDFTHRNQRTSI